VGALEVLEQWVKPLTGPLEDFLNETQVLASTHQTSVNSFNNLVQDLTDTNVADAFTGDAANNFVEMTGEYLTSEISLSGTSAALAGPLAEAGTTCTTMVTGVGEGVTTAVAAAPEVDALVTVTTVVDVTTVAQGGLDVPEDVVAAGATSLTIWIVIGILTGLAIAIGIAWWTWQSSMNNIANSPMPKLPKKPTAPVPPQMSGLTLPQQHDLESLKAEFPNVSPDDIKGLLLAGFTADEIRDLLKGGFTHVQIQSIITRIKQAQKDQNGKDNLGLTVKQIHDLAVSVAAACTSPDPDVQLEGQVGRALIADLVSFQRKVFNAEGVEIGEIDVETSNAIIEVTNTPRDKLKQLLKDQNEPLMNPNHKKVILYAPGYSHAADRQFASYGFPIIRSLKDLFNYLRSLT